MKTLFVISGEASGDAHGAGVLRALLARSTEAGAPVAIHGLGGPKMHALVGEAVEDWIGQAAVVGLWEVLKHYGWFRRKLHDQLRRLAELQPDTLLLIDYPGFNLRLAQAARKRFPGLRIVYYISPQVWAWHRSRIGQMAGYLDLMLCIFPFEAELYNASGLRTLFTGHPIFDHLGPLRTEAPRESGLIALLPGSRGREVTKLFPRMIQAAQLLREKTPTLQFATSAPDEAKAALLRHMAGDFPVSVTVGKAYDLMQRASFGWVASGTATLEAAFFGLPYALVYAVAPLTFWVGKRLIRVPYLGIVNILAHREVVRELIQDACAPPALAAEAERLLGDPVATAQLQADLATVIRGLGQPGGYEVAAHHLLSGPAS
jgi:lipid-A-disaccharide synthase